MKRAAVFLIKMYQKYISPIKSPCCRYTPSCSVYALEAFERFGFFKGFALSFARVCRCNPFSGGGYDPVPEIKKKKRRQ